MPSEPTVGPQSGLKRVPNAALVKQVLDVALRSNGEPLTTEQQLRVYKSVCRVAHVAHAEPNDQLVKDILEAYTIRGAVWPELVYPRYNRDHEGAYELVSALIEPNLNHEECFWALLAALLIVRPEDALSLERVGGSLLAVHPVG